MSPFRVCEPGERVFGLSGCAPSPTGQSCQLGIVRVRSGHVISFFPSSGAVFARGEADKGSETQGFSRFGCPEPSEMDSALIHFNMSEPKKLRRCSEGGNSRPMPSGVGCAPLRATVSDRATLMSRDAFSDRPTSGGGFPWSATRVAETDPPKFGRDSLNSPRFLVFRGGSPCPFGEWPTKPSRKKLVTSCG